MMEMYDKKISIVKIQEDDVKQAVFHALDLIKANKLFSKSNLKILIKPNLILPKKPEYAATTHPKILKAVIQWLKSFKPKEIIVADSSGTKYPGITKTAFMMSGLKKVCEEENVQYLAFEDTPLKKYIIHNPVVLEEIYSSELLEDVDIIINLPKIKTHSQCTLTCSIKNIFGTLILGNKAKMHSKFPKLKDFCAALVDIYSVSKPQLTIVDGYLCQEGQGPANGDVVKMNLILSGYDPVAIDTVVCKIIGFKPTRILYLKQAEEKGLGTTNLNEIEILGEKINDIYHAFKPPREISSPMVLPDWIISPIKKLFFHGKIEFNPQKCKQCSTCWENCPSQAIMPISITDNKLFPQWIKKKCIFCYCCLELCPHNAIQTKSNFVWMILEKIRSIVKLKLIT